MSKSPWLKMAGYNFQILPVQGFLLLWLVLHFSTWNLCTSADPVPTPEASLVPNNSTPLTCQSFRCLGERCYEEEAHRSNTTTCSNELHCGLYRLNSTSYTANCSSDCANATEMCITNTSVSMSQCFLECCRSPNCLRLNATAYGDLPPTTTPAPTTTTTKAPPKNGKVCSSFTCHGEGCYMKQKQKASAGCIVGYDFCEMKKTGPHFVAGCSKLCNKTGPACATGSKGPCFQECCHAMPKASCLKLDGRVHYNGAGHLTLVPLYQLLACAAAFGLTYALSFPSDTNGSGWPWIRAL